MWPSIPAYNPFGEVACPGGAKCDMPYCIFAHADKAPSTDEERPAKRLKVNDSAKKPAKEANSTPARTASSVFVGSLTSKNTVPPLNKDTTKSAHSSAKTPAPASTGKSNLPRSATRPISPPRKPKPESKPEVPVPLTPRKLAKEPAQFVKRHALLKLLRANLETINTQVTKSSDTDIKALALTANQLNKMAVDEEEKIGKESKSVYEHVLKQRIMALKKMKLEDWVRERKAIAEKERGTEPAPRPPKVVETGLTPKQEVILLSKMLVPLPGLDAYGYVTRIPSKVEVDESRLTLQYADHWEVCDRCNTRFQVFPDRREDGALTTGGTCKHHWGKRKPPGKKVAGQTQETRLTCCNQPVGSPPCSSYHTHVFKVKSSDAKRLSAIMPFIETPENDKADQHTAVCFDCEMGYTTLGLELLRLTAVSWPSHEPILDILVRPLGQLLDTNTRFSGVTPEQFIAAKPYDPENPTTDPKDLRIVDSPYIARDLFLSLISPSTPLVGHALENDLNAIRLIHPTLVDTVFLFPHPRGMPARLGLRNLASQYLKMEIQQAGAAGHDSYEDAKATGELVRYKVAEVWKRLRIDGWTVQDDGLFPPLPTELPTGKAPVTVSFQPEHGSKRTLREFEEKYGGDEEELSDGPQAKRLKEK